MFSDGNIPWMGLFLGIVLLSAPLKGGAETVTMALNISIPPYFIKEQDSGIEFEVIRESFKSGGVEVTPVFHRAGPRLQVYQKQEVQCVSTVSPDLRLPGHYSDIVVSFQNAAITLSKNKIIINSVSDLSKLNIIAFSGAQKYLGQDYVKAVSGNLHYRERLKNDLLPVLLFKERVQAVVTDVLIFEYFRKKIGGRINTREAVTIHPLFPHKDYSIACHDKRLIEIFNTGLKEVRRQGNYERIVEKFTKNYNMDTATKSLDD